MPPAWVLYLASWAVLSRLPFDRSWQTYPRLSEASIHLIGATNHSRDLALVGLLRHHFFLR